MKTNLLVLAGVSILSANANAVSVTWAGNGHEYDIVPAPSGISWSDADAAATGLGGGWHLATITSAAENAFVIGTFPGVLGSDGAGGDGYWLGGFQTPSGAVDEPAGAWNWVTGESWSYTNWAASEPNNATVTGEEFLHFDSYGTGGGTWNDLADSNLRLGYVIERRAPKGVPDASASALLFCAVLGLCGRAQSQLSNTQRSQENG